jgi:hypothetical protein
MSQPTGTAIALSDPLSDYSRRRGAAEQGRSVERRKQWSFPIGEDGSWTWRMADPDGDEKVSERTFKTLKECTEDAAKNGYVVWRSDTERRQGR